MKKVLASACLVGLAVLYPVGADAKKKPELSGLALQQIQSRDYEFPKNVTFSSVMSVLQDSGYRIQAADRDTGLITAVASTQGKTTWLPFVGFGRSKKTPVVSAYIEDRGTSLSRVRLNFVMTKLSSNQFGASNDEEPITDAAVYTDAFEKIDKAVFVRVALDSAPVQAVQNAAAGPSATQPVAIQPVAASSTVQGTAERAKPLPTGSNCYIGEPCGTASPVSKKQ